MKKRNVIVGLSVGITLFLGGVAHAVIGISAPISVSYSAQNGSTMQEFTSVMCAGMEVYTTVVLKDTRNSQDYRVRRMPDGRCWMIDNMKLAGVTLTSGDSNVTSDFTIPANPVQDAASRLTNGICVGGEVTGTGAYLTCDGTSTQSATNNRFIAYSDPVGVENNTYTNCIKQIGISVDSLTNCGYLYNYYTATAGTGGNDMTTGNAPSSICPAGWKLPTGGSGGEFAILNRAMATGDISAEPSDESAASINWRYRGPYEGASVAQYTSSFALSNWEYSYTHWSSTLASATSSYALISMTTNSYVTSTMGRSKINGYPVRCVL